MDANENLHPETPDFPPMSRGEPTPNYSAESLPLPEQAQSKFIPPANPQPPAPIFTQSTETRGFDKKPDGIQTPDRGLDHRIAALEAIVQVIRGTMQLPNPVSPVFIASVTDSNTSGLIEWQEQCFSNGDYVDFEGGRSSSGGFGDTAAIPLMPPSTPPEIGDHVVVWHVLDPYNRKYRFVYLTTSSSNGAIVKLTATQDPDTSADLGGGIYAGFLVIGNVSGDPFSDEEMPEGMTVTEIPVFYINTDEDGQNTHNLKIGAFVHGSVRGVGEDGTFVVVGESTNEIVEGPGDLTPTTSYDANDRNWKRYDSQDGPTGPHFGDTSVILTSQLSRMAIQDSTSTPPPTCGTMNILTFSRDITIGACGRVYRIDSEAKAILVALPQFDLTTAAVPINHTIHTQAWVLDSNTCKWVRTSINETVTQEVRWDAASQCFQKRTVPLYGFFEVGTPSAWACFGDYEDCSDAIDGGTP